MRIVYLGSPEYAVFPLQYLLEQKNHDIVGIITQPPKKKGRSRVLSNTPLAEYALQKNLKLLQPIKASAKDFLSQLKSLDPDVCITCAYGQILSQEFLDIPRVATINIHPSLLPKYRGATPVPAAILAGETTTGITILFTVKELDAGNIISQKTYTTKSTETTYDLLNRLFKESGPILEESLEKLKDKEFKGVPQDEQQVTHCKKITKKAGQINWQETSQIIHNRFRAFQPWPGSYTFFNNKRLIIKSMSIASDEQANSLKAGEFFFDKNKQILISRTKDSAIAIDKVQPEGKKTIFAKEYWNSLQKNQTDKLSFD